MTLTFLNKLSLAMIFSLVFSTLFAADHLDLQLTTAEGREVSLRFPIAESVDQDNMLVETVETVDGYRVGIAEDDTEIEELGAPEEYISLSLPDGTVLDLALGARLRGTEQPMTVPEEEEPVSETVALRLPSGMSVNITVNLPSYSTRPVIRKPPRIGIAEDDTDEEELGDPEGLIALLPSGTQVAITTDMSGYMERVEQKPIRIGIAEDDTDEEELGDPEGIITVLPVGNPNQRY